MDLEVVSIAGGTVEVEEVCGAEGFSPEGAVVVCPNIDVAVTGTATIAFTKSRLRIAIRLD